MGARQLIAVVGGGPSGAMAAEILARGGLSVVVLDDKLAWEKPCGGGVTPKALLQWPFLADAATEKNWVEVCEFISPSGRRLEVTLDPPIAIFSRRVLNGMMLERAHAAGAELLRERVTRICGQAGAWRLETRSGTLEAGFIVLATGARNPFAAQFGAAFAACDMMITAGYYVPGTSRRMQVRFLEGLPGYIWTFPRCDHFSAGICGKLNETSTAHIRRVLEDFLKAESFDLTHARFYAHVLPAPTRQALRNLRMSGPGWARIGDAAGFVDPITGEGLYYAFRSGELLAHALLQGRPEKYDDAVRDDFMPELLTAALLADKFYAGIFLGLSIPERMVRFAAASAAFRQLLREIMAGTQGYIGLRTRSYRTLPRVLFGLGWTTLLDAREAA